MRGVLSEPESTKGRIIGGEGYNKKQRKFAFANFHSIIIHNSLFIISLCPLSGVRGHLCDKCPRVFFAYNKKPMRVASAFLQSVYSACARLVTPRAAAVCSQHTVFAFNVAFMRKLDYSAASIEALCCAATVT